MDMRIPPLKTKVLLESNPLLGGGWALRIAGINIYIYIYIYRERERYR